MRTTALAIVVLVLSSFSAAFGQMDFDKIFAHVSQSGDVLYTLVEQNRQCAEQKGHYENVPTWRQARLRSPDLRNLPIVYKQGRPYVYFKPGARIEGLHFLNCTPASSGTSVSPQTPIELAATTDSSTPALADTAATFDRNVNILAALLALLIAAVLIWYFVIWPYLKLMLSGSAHDIFSLSRDDEEEGIFTEDELAEPDMAKCQFDSRDAYETFRRERLRQNPRDPEHLGLGFRLPTAPPATLAEHEETSTYLALYQGYTEIRHRQIVSVKVDGGIWPTMFYASEGPYTLDTDPRGNTLVVGIYYRGDGTVSCHTLHWKFCKNGVPLDSLSEDEQHFISDDTTFSDLTVLRNTSGLPDITLGDLDAGLRKRFGVRAKVPQPPQAGPPRVIVEQEAPTAPPANPADVIRFRVGATDRNGFVYLSIRGQAEQLFKQPCVHVPFATGEPRILTKPTHRDDGITFATTREGVTIKHGGVVLRRGLPAGSSGEVRFSQNNVAKTRRGKFRDRPARPWNLLTVQAA